MWESLYQRLEIIDTPGYEPLMKPSDAELDEFERMAGFKLPESYRKFIQVFGPGHMDCFKFFGPGYPDDRDVELAEHNGDVHHFDKQFIEVYGHADLIKRLFYFSSTFERDNIGWDPLAVRDEANYEYAVYGVPRVTGEGEVSEIASSFVEFIERVLDGTAMKLLGYSTEERPDQIFQPWVVISENEQKEFGG